MLAPGASPNNPHFNPFVIDEPSPSPSQAWFGTESNSNLPHDDDIDYGEEEPALHRARTGHVRAQTEMLSASTSSSHPLRSAGLRPPVSAGITRPQLAKRMHVDAQDDESPLEPSSSKLSPDKSSEEKVVLVHEVAAKDSLAGVALKYGISLAELRRANQLWASDSIHLRKVLYIPFDKSSHPHMFTVTTDPTSSAHDPSNGQTDELGTPATIRRIPKSQLSYFPPPSKPKRSNSARASTPHIAVPRDQKSRHARYATSAAPAPHHARYSTSSSPSLASMLTALPLVASTRDTLIARLSFESNGSNEDPDHELDDVYARRASEDDIAWADTPRRRRTSSMTRRSLAIDRSDVQLNGLHRRQSSVPQNIRTVQLQPSPQMQLPTATSVIASGQAKTVGTAVKRRGRLADVDFDAVDA